MITTTCWYVGGGAGAYAGKPQGAGAPRDAGPAEVRVGGGVGGVERGEAAGAGRRRRRGAEGVVVGKGVSRGPGRQPGEQPETRREQAEPHAAVTGGDSHASP